MLQIDDQMKVRHVGGHVCHTQPVPSRREVVAAMQRIQDAVELGVQPRLRDVYVVSVAIMTRY